MSKKLEVLQMLKDAGDRGVRSDEFYKRFNGRGVARIYDLRQDGHEIEGRPDGKYKRYRLLNSGVESGWKSGHDGGVATRPLRTGKATLDSGVERLAVPSGGAPPESLFDLPPAPNAFDPWERAA